MSGDLGLTIKDLLLSKVVCQSMSSSVMCVVVIGVCFGCSRGCNCEKKHKGKKALASWGGVQF